jgi:hypothetical protein
MNKLVPMWKRAAVAVVCYTVCQASYMLAKSQDFTTAGAIATTVAVGIPTLLAMSAICGDWPFRRQPQQPAPGG